MTDPDNFGSRLLAQKGNLNDHTFTHDNRVCDLNILEQSPDSTHDMSLLHDMDQDIQYILSILHDIHQSVLPMTDKIFHMEKQLLMLEACKQAFLDARNATVSTGEHA
jgi:hypothetical protein